jgi:hypothetical protein
VAPEATRPAPGDLIVTDSCDDNSRLNLSPVVIGELCALLARLCDDQLVGDDAQRLNHLLRENAEARRYYLHYVAVHSALAATACSPMGCTDTEAQLAVERLTLARFSGRITVPIACDVGQLTGELGRRPRSMALWAASVAVGVLIAATAVWFALPTRGPNQVTNAVVVDTAQPALNQDSTSEPLVAEVTFVSESAVWQSPNSSYIVASLVRSGQSLALERGQVELTYASGAKLLLTGPSEFLVEPAGGKLRRGELVARVPEAGHGFTIETPHGKVIDLGTEFGVVVDDFGVSQVSVYEGKVETLPTGSLALTQDKLELTSGRAIQWTANSVVPISMQGRRYGRADLDPVSRPNSLANASIDYDFRNGEFDADLWKTVGVTAPSSDGLRMSGTATTAMRPFLVSAREFDPSQGAITVVCYLRFENVSDAEQASCAILTRTLNEQSKPGVPWHDMLARSVRCCLKADPVSGEGLLEAGTKYEADRELMNISWSGFSRPKPDAMYRLEMRDDGLNVSFKVSLADNPSANKTINCRSLFRGSQNFIAIEGSGRGTMIVERLSIWQEAAPLEISQGQLATLGSETKPNSTAVIATQQLHELRPRKATLLLQDDFGGATLDSERWKTLGDVLLQDGQLQLGFANAEEHIDTWRARPYLLTKQKFDPAEGPLVILGKATFARNFLHGYGGSFAVMTRADDTHGGGPAWENSILRRGVRSNFWPAAYGFNHSLEIHEKPSPNTISLLVAEGFSILPTSRCYLFRVVDDGSSAQLTFIDPTNPAVSKTVSHPTSPALNFDGHIAFESCWGSPVLLDDVEILRLPAEGGVGL